MRLLFVGDVVGRSGRTIVNSQLPLLRDKWRLDFIVVNGKKIPSPIREEIVTIRGIIAGEYTVNVSHFQATTGLPVPATVKVQKLNPTAQVIFDDKAGRWYGLPTDILRGRVG